MLKHISKLNHIKFQAYLALQLSIEFLNMAGKFKIKGLGHDQEAHSIPSKLKSNVVKEEFKGCEPNNVLWEVEINYEVSVQGDKTNDFDQEQEHSFSSIMNSSVEEFCFDQCSFVGKYHMALWRHKKKSHEHAYFCDQIQCSFKGTEKYTLIRHRRNVHGI